MRTGLPIGIGWLVAAALCHFACHADERVLGTSGERPEVPVPGGGSASPDDNDVGLEDPVVPPPEIDECNLIDLDAVKAQGALDVVIAIEGASARAPGSDVIAFALGELADHLEQSRGDYRLVVIADYGDDDNEICFADRECTRLPIPESRYLTFQLADPLAGDPAFRELLASYLVSEVDENTSDGWAGTIRTESQKAFVYIGPTESCCTMQADDFDRDLLSLDPERFGTEEIRRYRFHSIVGLRANEPPSLAWTPNTGIQDEGCAIDDLDVGSGEQFQALSRLTGGLRFPFCQFESMPAMFREIGAALVEQAALACEYAMPDFDGAAVDPTSLRLSYLPGSNLPSLPLDAVTAPGECSSTGYFANDSRVVLCPDLCRRATADADAVIAMHVAECDRPPPR